jgi:L-lactate dehydrogenase complex protein LldG
VSARAEVLARVRRALAAERADPEAIRAEADGLVGELAAIRPVVDDHDAVERFMAKAGSERVGATVERLAAADELPGRVAAYLDRHGLAPRLAAALPPALAGLDWSGLALADTIDPNEAVALSWAEAAVAETGSLVVASSPAAPVLFNFLALHHLAVVRADDVVAYLEDAWQRFAHATLPRAVSVVTGTSGTADIEGRNVKGAHGPRYLHIYVVDRL